MCAHVAHLWVLLPEVLVQDDTEVVHVLLLVALHHHYRDPRNEVGRLLSDFGALVVQSPQHSACCCALRCRRNTQNCDQFANDDGSTDL